MPYLLHTSKTGALSPFPVHLPSLHACLLNVHDTYNVLRLVLCSCIRCRRIIPLPAQLEHELNKLMNRVWVDHAGVNMLTDKTLEVHESSLKLVRRGAVSGEQVSCSSGN